MCKAEVLSSAHFLGSNHHNYDGTSGASAPSAKITGVQSPSFWPHLLHAYERILSRICACWPSCQTSPPNPSQVREQVRNLLSPTTAREGVGGIWDVDLVLLLSNSLTDQPNATQVTHPPPPLLIWAQERGLSRSSNGGGERQVENSVGLKRQVGGRLQICWNSHRPTVLPH